MLWQKRNLVKFPRSNSIDILHGRCNHFLFFIIKFKLSFTLLYFKRHEIVKIKIYLKHIFIHHLLFLMYFFTFHFFWGVRKKLTSYVLSRQYDICDRGCSAINFQHLKILFHHFFLYFYFCLLRLTLMFKVWKFRVK